MIHGIEEKRESFIAILLFGGGEAPPKVFADVGTTHGFADISSEARHSGK